MLAYIFMLMLACGVTLNAPPVPDSFFDTWLVMIDLSEEPVDVLELRDGTLLYLDSDYSLSIHRTDSVLITDITWSEASTNEFILDGDITLTVTDVLGDDYLITIEKGFYSIDATLTEYES